MHTKRFQRSKTIPDTRKLHCFIPTSESSLNVKVHSKSADTKLVTVTEDEEVEEMSVEQIRGYVTVEYDGQWWLAHVQRVDPVKNEIQVTFLHPPGPAKSFVYPTRPDVLSVPPSQVLTMVDASATSSSGRTYKLSQKEMDKASFCLDRMK